MYNAFLFLHSWLRWVVLVAGLLAVLRSVSGMGGQQRWGGATAGAVRLFIITLDLQTLVGLVLYVGLSPFVRLAFSDVAGAMRDGDLRFWLVEHFAGMLVAVVLAHIGNIRIRKVADDGSKHRMAVAFMGVALAAILFSIPWPGMASARPLFRAF